MTTVRKIKDVIASVTPSFVFSAMKIYQKKKVQAEYGKKKGTARKCNFCENEYSVFAPYNNRPDRMCPNCFSLERHRMLLAYLRNHTELFHRPMNILHFAAEKCIHDIITQNTDATYETADLMIQFLPTLEVKPKHKMSITDIKFKDNTFDLFLCNHVLEHVPDDNLAMREIYRVLKPGGKALLMVPINEGATQTQEDLTFDRHQRRKYYGSQHHLRFYAADDFADRLENCGFSVTQWKTEDELDTVKYSLLPDEILFVCKK